MQWAFPSSAPSQNQLWQGVTVQCDLIWPWRHLDDLDPWGRDPWGRNLHSGLRWRWYSRYLERARGDNTDYSGARELAKAGEVCSCYNFLAFLYSHKWRSELTTWTYISTAFCINVIKLYPWIPNWQVLLYVGLLLYHGQLSLIFFKRVFCRFGTKSKRIRLIKPRWRRTFMCYNDL